MIIEKVTDLWQTPKYLLDQLKLEFQFDIDLCANESNKVAPIYFKDYLINELPENAIYDNEYVDNRVNTAFMNPPYSKPKEFIKKAWEDSKKWRIVCLLKSDTGTQWFGVFWDYEKHCPKEGAQVRFLQKRVAFTHPNVCSEHRPDRHINGINVCSKCDKNTVGSSNFGSVIVVMDRRSL